MSIQDEEGKKQWLKQAITSKLTHLTFTGCNAKYAWGRKLQGQLSWVTEHF